MAALTGTTPSKVFQEFSEHVNRLLHSTVCDAPLSLVINRDRPERAQLCFRQGDVAIAAKLRSPAWFLYFGQTLGVVKEGSRSWRLRTLAYTYKIQRGPEKDDPWVFRFEYVSREVQAFLHPRHHLHLPVRLPIPDTRQEIDLGKVHIPTGWVTVEELVRFLVEGLSVRSRKTNWDKLCRDSEEKFREWTGRSI